MYPARFRLSILIASLLPAIAAGQQDFSKVEIKSTPIRGNVFMLEGAGGNIGVSAGPDGILIIDDQYAPLAEKIRAALEKLRKPDAPGLKFVLNTHWHGDHTGGNKEFGRDAPIIAHSNVRKRMSTTQKVFGRETPPSPKEALPVVTFNESLSVHFNGEEIRVMHLPRGHTDGDSVIHFTKSNVVHMGDDFFSGMFPFVDLGSGGDVEGLARNVAGVIGSLPADVKIIPGHGPLSTLDDLKKFHRMLLETTDIVRKKIAAGKKLDDIKAEGLPDEWRSWGTGFIKTPQWIEIVYQSLTMKRPADDKNPK